MASCNFFEENYEAWKGGRLGTTDEEEMRHHASQCNHCAAFGEDTVNLRAALSALPEFQPSSTFEFQLNRKVRELGKGKSRKQVDMPRWATIGAGMATGIAIAVAVVFQMGPNTPVTSPYLADQPTRDISSAVIAQVSDTDTLAIDTLSVTEPSYDLNRHSQTVSTGQ
ncbi:MAG: hypothetical protein HN356_01950 [Calditrichaeota bacterium]|jgi:hypothetical protein|nr:hypothetical protein [Calditrichota bacterium]MBT7617524.1 hypothetical protein [Calditrichota bacterium]MBT7787841.1 hypothetical protein [Calditrichota bacterium]